MVLQKSVSWPPIPSTTIATYYGSSSWYICVHITEKTHMWIDKFHHKKSFLFITSKHFSSETHFSMNVRCTVNSKTVLMHVSNTHGEWGLAEDDQNQVPAALLPNNERPEPTSSPRQDGAGTKSPALLNNGTTIPPFFTMYPSHYRLCYSSHHKATKSGVYRYYPTTCTKQNGKVKSWSCPCSWHTGIHV